MREVKTARGRILNMQALLDANPKERAVSNVNINARGDLLDEHGNIKVDKATITTAYYKDDPKATKRVSIKKSTDRDVEKLQPKVKKETKKEEPMVLMDAQPTPPATVNESIKTREDGSQYKEVEYEDGTMEVIELEKNET